MPSTYKKSFFLYLYNVVIESDDIRVLRSVSNWLDIGTLNGNSGRYLNGDKITDLYLRFYSNDIDHISIEEFDEASFVGSFDDVKFYSSEKASIFEIVNNGKSIVIVEKGSKSARAYICREHLDIPWLLSHRIVFLPLMQLMRQHNAYYIHAGCVEKDGKCVLICGESGSGKSTLVYTLSRSGFSVVSDDAVFVQLVKGEIILFALPERIKLTKTSCSFFPELRAECDNGFKMEFPVKRTSIDQLALSGVPSLIVYPEITNSRKSKLIPMSKEGALIRLLQQSVLPGYGDNVELNMDVLLKLCEKSSTYKFMFGRDFDEIAEIISTHL